MRSCPRGVRTLPLRHNYRFKSDSRPERVLPASVANAYKSAGNTGMSDLKRYLLRETRICAYTHVSPRRGRGTQASVSVLAGMMALRGPTRGVDAQTLPPISVSRRGGK
ncbi:unnamed protein product [Nezara viridula]|uniref:Uncharacterized protein n=1 Tax=Nezara viridula TaxID=85310 RepID=A0A9P0HCX5_NEZVI|nr:unnamed protein product [Nezara viridula]